MIKRLLFLILVLIAFSLVAQKQETTYLNLDFEDLVGKGIPKHWQLYQVNCSISGDKTRGYSGEACLRMEGEKEKKITGYVFRYFPTEDGRGKKVRFSGFIKTENITGGYAGFWWQVSGKDYKQMVSDEMKDRGATGTTDWKEYVIELDIPTEGDKIIFGTIMTGSGTAWFDDLRISLDGKPYKQVKPKPIVPTKTDLAWIRANAIPFKSADPTAGHEELMPLKKMIGNRRIVALGEATHGTSEFFKMKHRLTRFLAEEMGFTVFAIEANMPEARKVNRYVLTGEGDPKEALAGMYFWTWNTTEVLAMIEWMREYNKSGKGHIEFHGFDMQYPQGGMESVRAFVKKADPGFVETLENHYKLVREQYEIKKKRDGSSVDYKKWYDATGSVHDHLAANRDTYLKSFDAAEVDRVIRDADVVRQGAELYLPGKRSRDHSMADNFNWILAHSPKGTKVVTWAHNGHVSRDYHLFKSMGSILHEEYGDDMMVFGFTYHRGTYTARGKNGINIYGSSPSGPDTFAWFFKSTGIPNLILDLRKASDGEPGSHWLNLELDFRDIGSQAMDYGFEKQNITRQFDVIIYFEESTPSGCFRHGEK